MAAQWRERALPFTYAATIGLPIGCSLAEARRAVILANQDLHAVRQHPFDRGGRGASRGGDNGGCNDRGGGPIAARGRVASEGLRRQGQHRHDDERAKDLSTHRIHR